MAFYPEELVDEVRSRSDIVDVIGRDIDLKKKGTSYFGLCSFHNEKTGSFSVSPSKQIFYCFGCGEGGNVISFVMKYENLTFPEAVKQLADQCGVKLPEREMSEQEKAASTRRERLMAANKDAATYYYSLLRSDRGKRAMDYFIGRKLSPETMKHFGLGYSDSSGNGLYRFLRSKGYEDELLSDTGLINLDEVKGGRDKFWNRAMFPIMDQQSRVIAFGGRVMGDGEPKYLNSRETPIFDKSRTLYGLHLAKKSRRGGVILCEGYMDVIALHQAGFDNALASLGTSLTEGHAGLIARYQKEVFLSYDSDGAGVKAALRAIPILKRAGITARVVHMDPYKDPDEFIKALGAEEYEKRLKEAENAFIFSLSVLEKEHDRSDPASWTVFQNEVAKRLLEFPQELERDNYLKAVCARFDIPVAAMQRQVAQMAAAGVRSTGTAVDEDEADSREGPGAAPGGVKSGKSVRDERTLRSQLLILQWIQEFPDIFPAISRYLEAEDFEEGVIRDVATLVFEAAGKGESLDVAALMDRYPEEEDQKLLARMISDMIQGADEPGKKEKAVKETLLHIKRDSLQRRISELEATDPAILQLQMDSRNIQKQIESLKI